MHVSVHTHVHTGTRAFACGCEGPRLLVGHFPLLHPTMLFLKQSLSLDLAPGILAALAGQQAPRICLLSPVLTLRKCAYHAWLLCKCWEFKLRHSCLYNKWTTSPAPFYFQLVHSHCTNAWGMMSSLDTGRHREVCAFLWVVSLISSGV